MYHDQRYRTARRLIRSFIIVKPLSVFPTYRILKAINRVDRAKKSPAKVGIKTYLKKKWSFRPLDSTPIGATAISINNWTWSVDSLSTLSKRVKRSLILSFELSTIFRRSLIEVWQAASPAITCCNVLIGWSSREIVKRPDSFDVFYRWALLVKERLFAKLHKQLFLTDILSGCIWIWTLTQKYTDWKQERKKYIYKTILWVVKRVYST